MRFSILEQQLLATLAYFSQFNFPLTVDEIDDYAASRDFWLRLRRELGLDVEDKKKNNANIEQALSGLVKKRVVKKYKEYYFLEGDVDERLKKQKLSEKFKGQEVEELLKVVKNCSDVVGAGITGAVAFKSLEEDPDLDLIIVTKPGSLWSTRLKLLVTALVLGKKSWPWQQQKSKWCFNLWLTVDDLEIAANKRNFYAALESKQIDWIYDVDEIKQKFYQENPWISKYFKNFKIERRGATIITGSSFLKKIVNWLIYKLNKPYLMSKNQIPGENLQLNQAFMHQEIIQNKYLKIWHQNLKKIWSKF